MHGIAKSRTQLSDFTFTFQVVGIIKRGSGAVKKNLSAYAGDIRHGLDPWVRTNPWRREWQLTPELLPGKFHGQRSLEDYDLWGHQESGTTE